MLRRLIRRLAHIETYAAAWCVMGLLYLPAACLTPLQQEWTRTDITFTTTVAHREALAWASIGMILYLLHRIILSAKRHQSGHQ
jgi:TRAP-type mannitol/chloroaromatic compound transport system permease small subunit